MTGSDLPDHMRVVVCGPDGALALDERPTPRPAAGEVVVGLRVCGLCDSDVASLGTGRVSAGRVLGHELVGTVAAMGRDVRGVREGDRVVSPRHVACGRCSLCRRGARTACADYRLDQLDPGGFAEYIRIREPAARRAMRVVPDDVGDAAIAFLDPAARVLRGLDSATVSVDSGSVLVLGAGTMGLLHLMVLRAVRPGLRIVVGDHDLRRRGLASRLGAHSVCEPDDESLAQAVGRVSDGIGADAVFDTVGGSCSLASVLDLVRPGGTLVLLAGGDGNEFGALDPRVVVARELKIVGARSPDLEERDRVATLIESHRLDASPLVTHRLPLERIDEAVELARTGRALKILMTPATQR